LKKQDTKFHILKLSGTGGDFIYSVSKLWNRIVSAASPGMAPADSLYGQPKAFEQAVFFQCLSRIMRTGGGEPAGRAQPGRNNPLIKFYQKEKGKAKNL
jgi:hypothetical protein